MGWLQSDLKETLLTNPTLLMLVLMSVVTLALALERWYWLIKHKRAMRHGLKSIITHLTQGHHDSALSLHQSLPRHGAFDAFSWVLAHKGDAAREAHLHRLLARFARRAKRRLWVIGSSASIAPFVGLFGTVLGIMRAFESLAREPGGGVAVVGNGIAEALVTTAAGIFVAVEAVVLFNALQVLAATGVAEAREGAASLVDATQGRFAERE